MSTAPIAPSGFVWSPHHSAEKKPANKPKNVNLYAGIPGAKYHPTRMNPNTGLWTPEAWEPKGFVGMPKSGGKSRRRKRTRRSKCKSRRRH